MINSASTYPDDRFNIVWDTLLAGMADEPMPTLRDVRRRGPGRAYTAADMPNLLDFIGSAGKRAVTGGANFTADGVTLRALFSGAQHVQCNEGVHYAA